MSSQRHVRRSLGTLFVAVAASIFSGVVQADNFAKVSYDVHSDQLIVTMSYRGTNPSHAFTLQWGPCKDHPGGHAHDIVAVVLDSQWKDAAQRQFTVTTHFSLVELRCRPAALTLKTAPNFYYTLQIPDRSVQKP